MCQLRLSCSKNFVHSSKFGSITAPNSGRPKEYAREPWIQSNYLGEASEHMRQMAKRLPTMHCRAAHTWARAIMTVEANAVTSPERIGTCRRLDTSSCHRIAIKALCANTLAGHISPCTAPPSFLRPQTSCPNSPEPILTISRAPPHFLEWFHKISIGAQPGSFPVQQAQQASLAFSLPCGSSFGCGPPPAAPPPAPPCFPCRRPLPKSSRRPRHREETMRHCPEEEEGKFGENPLWFYKLLKVYSYALCLCLESP